MNEIKAIILDSGGVFEIHQHNKIRKDLSKKYNISIKKIDRVLRVITNNLNLGKTTINEEIKKINFNKTIKVKRNEFEKIYYSRVKYNNDLPIIISKKYEKIPLYLASNNWKENVNRLKKEAGFSIFKKTLFSYVLKNKKPSKKFYMQVFKIIKIKPEKCIIIDDKILNLKVAKKIGAKVIHFKNNKNCLEKIKKFI